MLFSRLKETKSDLVQLKIILKHMNRTKMSKENYMIQLLKIKKKGIRLKKSREETILREMLPLVLP